MNQQKLPNATTVLVLGIVSIVTCCCYGVVGIITGGIGLYLAKQDQNLYNQNPDLYYRSDYNNLKTGKILCIIGISLSILYLGYMIVVFNLVGMEGMQNPQLIQEKLRELIGR